MNIQQMTAKTGRNVRSAFRFAKTSIQGRCAQAVDSHRHTAPRDGFPDSEDKSGSRLPENQSVERPAAAISNDRCAISWNCCGVWL